MDGPPQVLEREGRGRPLAPHFLGPCLFLPLMNINYTHDMHSTKLCENTMTSSTKRISATIDTHTQHLSVLFVTNVRAYGQTFQATILYTLHYYYHYHSWQYIKNEKSFPSRVEKNHIFSVEFF